MITRNIFSDASAFSDFTVAAVQMEPRIGEKAQNLTRSLSLIAEAASQGASVIVLPELTTSGYAFSSRSEAFALAEPVPDGESTQAWSEAAKRLNVYVTAGVAERDGNKLYNSAVTIGPNGYIGLYRKLHLWGDEHLIFEPGNLGLPIFHTELGRFASIICYDGWFPEVYRVLAAKGADIVAMPTNWVPMPGQPSDRMAMAATLAMASAHSNGLCIVCANRYGTEREQSFIGQSLIVGAEGWPLAGPAAPDGEEILYAKINLSHSRKAQHLNEFNNKVRDRRDDLFPLADV